MGRDLALRAASSGEPDGSGRSLVLHPGEPEELLLPEQLLSAHSSDSLRLTRPGVLTLTWSMLAASNWLKVFLLPATLATLEYH